jgi:hypothetical protein
MIHFSQHPYSAQVIGEYMLNNCQHLGDFYARKGLTIACTRPVRRLTVS